jgi:hypothetical protein
MCDFETIERHIRSGKPETALPLLFKLCQEQNKRIVQLERTISVQAEKIAALEQREKQRHGMVGGVSSTGQPPTDTAQPSEHRTDRIQKVHSYDRGIQPLNLDPKISMRVDEARQRLAHDEVSHGKWKNRCRVVSANGLQQSYTAISAPLAANVCLALLQNPGAVQGVEQLRALLTTTLAYSTYYSRDMSVGEVLNMKPYLPSLEFHLPVSGAACWLHRTHVVPACMCDLRVRCFAFRR